MHNHYWDGWPAFKCLQIPSGKSGGTGRNCRRQALYLIEHGERHRHGTAIGMNGYIHSFLVDAPLLCDQTWNRTKLLDGGNTERSVIRIDHHEANAGC